MVHLWHVFAKKQMTAERIAPMKKAMKVPSHDTFCDIFGDGPSPRRETRKEMLMTMFL